jgi:N4-gp56 family major capsid protein
VNRVGFSRVERQGTLENYGFFSEYTEESLNFDTDAELYSHLSRESVVGANKISEALLQRDLLNSAGTIRYAGSATSRSNVSQTSLVTFDDFVKLGVDLDKNKTPRDTKIITGSRMVDTRTIRAARYMFVHPDMQPMLEKLVGHHGRPALITTEQYADKSFLMPGELGIIHTFRVIVNQEMFKYAGVGASYSGSDFLQSSNKIDVFPMLVVGNESFSTIGFQQYHVNSNNEDTTKFRIISKKPSADTATSHDDPYGRIGFMSIQWYYGFLAKRPERIAVLYTAVST